MNLDKSILEDQIDWYKNYEGDFVFCRKDVNWKVRMNDFPGEPLYTLFVEGNALFDFDDWPDTWYKMD